MYNVVSYQKKQTTKNKPKNPMYTIMRVQLGISMIIQLDFRFHHWLFQNKTVKLLNHLFATLDC